MGSLTAPFSINSPIPSATQGSILFAGANGVLAQDNANLFWDDTNKRLGIGKNTPTVSLDVAGAVSFNQFTANTPNVANTINGAIVFQSALVQPTTKGSISNLGNTLTIHSDTGGVTINNAANSANNLIMSDSGNFSFRGFFAANGITASAPTSGYGVPTGNAVIANFPGATATLAQCSAAIAQIITDLKAAGLQLA